MKYALSILVCAAMYCACTPAAPAPVKADSTAVAAAPPEEQAKGTYRGDFAGAPIFITINYANGGHVAGYDLHKGLRRNLHGKLQQTPTGWTMALSEPGDHPFDGHFQLAFDTGFHTAKGKWIPQNRGTLQEKTFTLSRPEASSAAIVDNAIIGNIFNGDHCDISFNNDGSCILNYYEKLNDSTFALQLNTLRGSWKRTGNKVDVNWQPNERFGKRTSTFSLKNYVPEDNFYPVIEGDGFNFSIVL